MSWDVLYYQWFLRELIAALEALEADPTAAIEGGEAGTMSAGGQQTVSESGRIITPRQSNLVARPGQRVVITDAEGWRALGDNARYHHVDMPQPEGVFPSPGLYPDLPRWTQTPAGLAQNHYHYDGAGGWRARAIPLFFFTPQPDLLPPVGGITRRRVLGHNPRWMTDFWWLDADRVEPLAYGTALINATPVYQGIIKPYWHSRTAHGTSGLVLPVEQRLPDGGDPEVDPNEPHLDAFHWYRGFGDVGVAQEQGTLEYGQGFGLLYFPAKEIRCTINITPAHLCIYPGGDFATRYNEFWWVTDPAHEGPPGLEGTEEAGFGEGIRVNAHVGPLSDFITVLETSLPTGRVGPDGVATPLSSVPATRYTFTPPGVGLNETDKEWLYEGSWSFTKDITLQPSDWAVTPNALSFAKVVSPLCIPLTTYASETGTTTMRVSGTYTVKDYESGDENINSPTEAFLVKPDPLDDTTWYWVHCVIHPGDYVRIHDPTAPTLVEPYQNDVHNAFEDSTQYGLVTDVQPTTPGAPEDDDWTLTFAHVVRRFNPNYRVNPSLFAMPPRWFGDAGTARVFTVTDEVQIKVRVTTLLRPGTAIYGDYGASVETNWIDREYQPDPQTGWFALMHTPGYEVAFYRQQTISAAGISTATLTHDHRIAYQINETEDRTGIDFEDPVYQWVALLTPGPSAMSMLQGIVRIGDRYPNWDESYALWNQGLGRGILRIRRPPYSWESPDYSYYDPACDPPAIPYVDTADSWPMTEAFINDGGWVRPIEDPHVHAAGETQPFIYRPIFRRDRYLAFNGHLVGHIVHPPNINYLETSTGAQNEHVRAHFEATAPTIYEDELGNILYNPLARTAAQGGGTWFGIEIPSRWYDADAILMSDGSIVGVVLAWHEDRAGQEDEFMLYVSSATAQPVLRYFPDEVVGGVPQTPTQVHSEEWGWWPLYAIGTVGAIQVLPNLPFLQPGWPFRTGRLGPFVVRQAGTGDRAGHTLASAFQGTPRVALVV